MKKLLVLVTVMVAILGFSTGAFAAWGDPICTSCTIAGDKTPDSVCVLGHIPLIPAANEMRCYDFDYDARYGYCTASGNGTGNLDYNVNPCKLIFNICNCEDPTDFEAGQTIGIKMTIMVDGAPGENGAYWSAGAVANVAFDAHPSEADACADTPLDRSFGAGKFFDSDGVEVLSFASNPDCYVYDNERAVVILTNIDAGYQITPQDELDKVSHWVIDVAPIRIDPALFAGGEKISVLVELLNQESGGICADCTPVCECEIDVAIVGCVSEYDSGCIYFPYVIVRDEVDSEQLWTTGITVSNVSSLFADATTVLPANAAITYTLVDATGASFTKTVGMAGILDVGILYTSGWTGGTPAEGRAILRVDTNFAVDGYEVMTDGVFVGSTLPRGCCPLCYDR